MGRVKRRLAREIGASAAIRFYRSCLAHTAAPACRDPRWRTVLAVDQRTRSRDARSPLAEASRAHAARRLAISALRMQRLFMRLPPGPVVIVGSDIPSIRPAHIAEAFRLLGGADAVFGPAPDGGYWLVGLRRTPRVPAPFAARPLVGPHALADTLAISRAARCPGGALERCRSAEDLRRDARTLPVA